MLLFDWKVITNYWHTISAWNDSTAWSTKYVNTQGVDVDFASGQPIQIYFGYSLRIKVGYREVYPKSSLVLYNTGKYPNVLIKTENESNAQVVNGRYTLTLDYTLKDNDIV